MSQVRNKEIYKKSKQKQLSKENRGNRQKKIKASTKFIFKEWWQMKWMNGNGKAVGQETRNKNRIKPRVVLIEKLALFILYQLREKRRKDLTKEKKEKKEKKETKEKRKYYRKRKEREKKWKDKLAVGGESKSTVFGGEDQSLSRKNAIWLAALPFEGNSWYGSIRTRTATDQTVVFGQKKKK